MHVTHKLISYLAHCIAFQLHFLLDDGYFALFCFFFLFVCLMNFLGLRPRDVNKMLSNGEQNTLAHYYYIMFYKLKKIHGTLLLVMRLENYLMCV